MFGSLVKAMLPGQMNTDRKDIKVVAIMPCTAKKFEAQRPELAVNGDPDVDHVLTTQELALPEQSPPGVQACNDPRLTALPRCGNHSVYGGLWLAHNALTLPSSPG